MSDQPETVDVPVAGTDTKADVIATPVDATPDTKPVEAAAPVIEEKSADTNPDTNTTDTNTDTKTEPSKDVEMTDAAPDAPADASADVPPPVDDDPNDPDVDEDALHEDEEDDKLPKLKPKSKEGSEAAEEPTTPAPRKRGRPPGSKNKATLVREIEMEEDEEALKLTAFSAVGGFGPGSGGVRSGSARWAARGRGSRGGTSHLVMVPRDENGNPYPVEDDELLLPEDPAGEVKVNKQGELQGGREYRVRTFTVLGRGRRLYMLSTEPARCMGFRDSYLLFQKHRRLHKVIADEGEKFDLIERDIIPHSYKGRSIGIVTARSVFREFGAKIVLGGKKIVDDYYVQEAVDAGSTEGEIADPDDPFNHGRDHSKDLYVAWLGGAGGGAAVPTVPIVPPPITHAPAKRRKMPGAQQLSPQWMYDHALAASRFNSSLLDERREGDDKGFIVEPLTGVRFVPQLTQPQVSEWFKVGLGKKTVVTEEMQFSPVTRTGLQVSFDLNDIDIDESVKEAILDQLEVEGTT